jgi:hypothetical protein
MKRIAVLLVTTGIASAASAQEAHGPRDCSAIQVSAPGLRKPPRNLRFVTSQVLDLEFATELERATYGSHVLHFKVTTPSGFLYQDLAMPFHWRRPGRGPREREKDGVMKAADVPAGAAVQQLGPANGRGSDARAVRARLPVAGTSITMSTLYGRWSVQAFLDDVPRPCSPAASFTLSSK